ncbi:MAG TPA: hypothetical protein VFN55_13260 [Solirubrobacteraceae bacterium]|nr:hypothetical protein [Solirubrobacteraceae bacterium]
MSPARRRCSVPAGVAVAVTALIAILVSGCGSSGSGGVSVPAVSAARVFSLGGFTPAGTITAGRPVTVSFDVRQPDGRPLTRYKTGPGPHTGVHLIIVRDDLASIIHLHPPIAPDGRMSQRVIFPAPGPYRVMADVYPDLPGGQPNFQIVRNVTVAGAYHPRPLPPFHARQTVDGYHFVMTGHPGLHAIQAAFVHVEVTDPHGAPVHFTPWFGALAHAIFFHQGSLDYFHTHVCAAGAPNCSSLLGAARVTGHTTAPGKITLGVLLPVAGTWRLFLQLRVHGRVLTAPFTLRVTA